MENALYKVMAIQSDTIKSEIVEERLFTELDTAEKFVEEYKNSIYATDVITAIAKIETKNLLQGVYDILSSAHNILISIGEKGVPINIAHFFFEKPEIELEQYTMSFKKNRSWFQLYEKDIADIEFSDRNDIDINTKNGYRVWITYEVGDTND